LLLRLKELGLLTYPSPLLGGLLEELPEVLAAEVLPLLDPTDIVVFGQAARACRAAVVAFGVPQEEVWSDEEGSTGDEGTEEGGPLLLRVQNFVGSVARMTWAKTRGCPWDVNTCAYYVAEGGQLEVLKWAWEHRCPWNWEHVRAPLGAGIWRCCSGPGSTGASGTIKHVTGRRCGRASGGAAVGARAWVPVERIHLFGRRLGRAAARAAVVASERLPVEREDDRRNAALGGNLEVLKWAREHDCPWDERACGCCSARAPGRGEVGAGARLSVERGDA
jgi:hypothetical protein